MRAYSSQVFWLFIQYDGVIEDFPIELKRIFCEACYSDTNLRLSARCFNLRVLRQVSSL